MSDQVKRADVGWVSELLGLCMEALNASELSEGILPVLSHIAARFEASSSSMAVVEHDAELVIIGGLALPPEAIGRRIPFGEGIMGACAQAKKARLISGVYKRANETEEEARRRKPNSAICIPLVVRDHVVGAVTLNRAEGMPLYVDDDLDQIRDIMDLLGMVVEMLNSYRRQRADFEALQRLHGALTEKQSQLDTAHRQLKDAFDTTLKMFSQLVELAEAKTEGHSRRVAAHARAVARQLGLDELEVDDVYVAGLLHDIGKIGMPDRITLLPLSKLSPSDRELLAEHPIRGEGLLMPLELLRRAGTFVRGHHERVDGRGYPDGLRGEAIPMGARILAVVNDFDALRGRTRFDQAYSVAAARKFLSAGRHTVYDATVVDAFFLVLDSGEDSFVGPVERVVPTSELTTGMILTRDLTNADGLLLLCAGGALTRPLIDKIRQLERMDGKAYLVHVRVDS